MKNKTKQLTLCLLQLKKKEKIVTKLLNASKSEVKFGVTICPYTPN